jgi:hypothetical protein
MPQSRRCFVISPIGQPGTAVRHHADDVYRFIIRPALEKFGIEPERSDEISESGQITEQMFERIFRADLCVVVLTGFNPNVFYELAVAQCAARPTLLLLEQGLILPFDVKDLRTIEYQLQPIGPLVDGYYSDIMEDQVRELVACDWTVPGLFEQFRFAPRLQTEQQVRRLLQEARPKTLQCTSDCSFALPFDPERRISIVTGDIVELSVSGKLVEFGIDAIASLENTYFQLDSYFATSMSGKLRYLDAEKTAGGRLRDSLREGLDQKIQESGILLPAAPGTVIPTSTHALQKQGVKALFHVAGTQGAPGDGYELLDEAVDDCVRGVFDAFAEQAQAMRLETLLLPMFGSFMTRLDQLEVVRRIFRTVLLKMEYMHGCRHVFLLAWIESQRAALRQIAGELGLQTIVETPDHTMQAADQAGSLQ